MGFLSGLLGIGGSVLNQYLGGKAAKKEYARQKTFAQNSLQWRVADATKAGIHPLYAVNANLPTYAPSIASGGDFGASFANMGANLDDMVGKRQTTASKSVSRSMEVLSLENASLQNDYLRAQIRNLDRAGLPPAVGADEEGIKLVPPQRTTSLSIGLPYKTNPAFVDAQTIEDRYGDAELVSMLTALVNAGADAWHNIPFYGASRQSTGFPRFGGRR